MAGFQIPMNKGEGVVYILTSDINIMVFKRKLRIKHNSQIFSFSDCSKFVSVQKYSDINGCCFRVMVNAVHLQY